MLKKLFNGFMLLALLTGLLAVAPAAPVAAQAGKGGLAPDALLNPDGTLKLDGSTRGALDLSGYSVQIDPQLGPVFTPLAPQNSWAAIGTEGGPFQETINEVVMVGTDVYVGGWFRDAAGIPEADYIARWDGAQWLALSNGGTGNSAISSAVDALLFAGGTLYVGGWFSTVYNTSGNPIANTAKLARWDGSAWSAVPGITSNLSDTVEALAYYSNKLYVGGKFTNANGNGAADYVLGIDLNTSTLFTLGSNGASGGSLNNYVYALAVNSTGAVFAGGFFTNVMNGVTTLNEADYIAKWDGVNWSALGSNGGGNGALGSIVGAIAVDGSDNVYAGGSFTNAAGIATADFIAKWDGAAWSGLGSNGSGNGALLSTGGGTTIQDILVSGTDVYVGGFFYGSSGIPTADNVAKFDTAGGTWSGLGSDGAGNGAINGGVTGIALNGSTLYTVGYFFDVSNGGTILPTADYFAAWDGSNWSTYGLSNGVFRWGITSMAVIGTDVYVGGDFADAGGDPRIDYLARWDGSKWNPVGNLTQTYGSLTGNVLALAVDGTDLYIGGVFAFVYNEGNPVANSNCIIKWDGSTFTSVGGGLNNTVNALLVDASHNLYVGGLFTDAGSIGEADYIAKWNGSTWSALGGNGSGNGALNNTVRALALRGSDLLIGGHFTSVVDPSNTPIANTAYLAKWNGSAWSAMDGITQPLSSWIYTIAVSGSDVYLGGNFFNLNGISNANYLAKWNGSAWSGLGSDGLGSGSFNSSVNAIAVDGGNVYVGGQFTDPGNSNNTNVPTGDRLVKWDGSQWTALSSNGSNDSSVNATVTALKIIDNDLWVGGDFVNLNNNGTVIREADHLAAFGLDLAPQVVSITCAVSCTTSSVSADFTVTFSESVLNVDTADFNLVATGVTGASITGVSGSGATRTVTVNTGTGNGTIRLDIPNTATIIDTTTNALGGLPYIGGQTYTVKKILTFRSLGASDGWVLESGANTNAGGTLDSAAITLRLGDEMDRRSYRSVLSFKTASLPDNAVISKVTLRVRRQGVSGGGDPVALFGGFMTDIRKGTFGTAVLQVTDWQSLASKTLGPFSPALVSGWYSIDLTPGKGSINKLTTSGGLTQIRLRFNLQNNLDNIANFLSLYSGNAGAGSRPQLIIEFSTP